MLCLRSPARLKGRGVKQMYILAMAWFCLWNVVLALCWLCKLNIHVTSFFSTQVPENHFSSLPIAQFWYKSEALGFLYIASSAVFAKLPMPRETVGKGKTKWELFSVARIVCYFFLYAWDCGVDEWGILRDFLVMVFFILVIGRI